MSEQEILENIIIEWLSEDYRETWDKFTTGFHRYNARDLIQLFEDRGYQVVKKGTQDATPND